VTPRLPRDVSGRTVIAALERFEHRVVRRSGSHVRLEHEDPPRHAITVPDHPALRLGTLAAIVAEVARARSLTRDEIVAALRRG